MNIREKKKDELPTFKKVPEWNKEKYRKLQKVCLQNGLRANGTKNDLVRRLIDAGINTGPTLTKKSKREIRRRNNVERIKRMSQWMKNNRFNKSTGHIVYIELGNMWIEMNVVDNPTVADAKEQIKKVYNVECEILFEGNALPDHIYFDVRNMYEAVEIDG